MDTNGHSAGILWIEVTNGCNLFCRHCYSDSYPGSHVRDRLTKDEYITVIRDGVTAGFSRIQFIGGEPTLNKDLPEFIDAASAAGYDGIEVFSNLRSVPSPVRDAIFRGGVNVATSVYSDDSEVHDRITDTKGSFNSLLANLRCLLDGGVSVRAGFIEMDENRGQFNRTSEMLARLGNIRVGRDEIRHFGRGAVRQSNLSDLCGACAGHTACVSYEGKVLPCIMARNWPLGSLREASLSEILSAPLALQRRLDIAKANRTVDAGCYPDGDCTPRTCLPHLPGCPPNTCHPHLVDAASSSSSRF